MIFQNTIRGILKYWRGTMKFFLCVIGMVMIIEGIPYFAFPEKMKVFIQTMLELPDETLRRFGLVIMITGLVIVYFSRM